MKGVAAFIVLALAAAPPQEGARAAARGDGAHHLIFLADNRPIFVRLRVTLQGKPFEASWIESIRTLHASLDRNGDGKLATNEVNPNFVTALVQMGTGAGDVAAPAELDVQPKDGVISIDELAEALARTWARSGCNWAGRRLAAPMRCLNNLTAIRTTN